ncbi:MAG: diguanylate cyclase [Planctomycetes bacterium]|nr:diguanylate cyclase [Planctomycetota bacterium]
MNLALFLPWFPVVLAVGVGGRLLGRGRGFALGVLCALFWVVLVHATAGAAVWQRPGMMLTVLAGAAAIIAMGGWAGESAETRGTPAAPAAAAPGAGVAEHTATLECLSAACDTFDDWLEDHRNDANPWPAFDELIRTVLYQSCRATHVRPFRLLSEGEELTPLRDVDPFHEARRVNARDGIVGEVVRSGRAYVADCHPGTSEVPGAPGAVDRLAWCFACSQGTERLGAVLVGQVGVAPQRNRALLRTVEHLIGMFWYTLREAIRSRAAALHDPVSGLLTREAFLHFAEQTLRESHQHAEPSAVAVIGLEGMRALNDAGRWEVADDLVREVSAVLRGKVRPDDRLGRFDGSRFIMLFRRVDSDLALLIVSQIMTRLKGLCGDLTRWREPIEVRCGIAGGGSSTPDLRALVSRSLQQNRRARLEERSIASDLEPALEAAAGV